MNHTTKLSFVVGVMVSCLLALVFFKQGSVGAATSARAFPTAQVAADALIDADEKFDVAALEEIFGPEGKDIIHSGEPARDQEIAKQFAEQARTKMVVSVDPRTKRRAFISVGNEDWPFPVPIVKTGTTWSFDSKAGLDEILFRRIGRDELNAIAIAHGFVEAQDEYA